MSTIEIDGSFLEGGGQILRNALSLSCILRRPIRVTKIRANRPNPGLSNQHLYGLNLLQQITGAQVRGNSIKSTEIEFNPEDIKAGKYFIDTHTAASITLVLQAALPVLIFGRDTSELLLVGGTNVGMAPQVDSMSEVLRPNLERFGVSFDFELCRRGYYPRGGGSCKVTVPVVRNIQAAKITSFGRLEEICGWCYVAGRLPLHLAEDMKQAAERALYECKQSQGKVDIEAYKESADMAQDNGSGIILKAVTSDGCTLGASGLGDRKVNANELGTVAAKELADYIKRGTCVDQHVQDQLILFMALAKGTSTIQTSALTNHTKTAIHVAEIMTGVKFQVEDAADGHVMITVEGIGHTNKHLNE